MRKRRHLLLLLGIIIGCFSGIMVTLNTYAENKEKKPVGTYAVQDYPYKSDSVAKKSLDKMKNMDNFVYVEHEVKMLSNKNTYKQVNNSSDYIYYGKIKKGRPDGYGVILEKHHDYYIVKEMGKFKKGGLNGYGYQFELGTIYPFSGRDTDSLFLSYEGEFKNGIYNGKGISYICSNSTDNQIAEYEKYLDLADEYGYVAENDEQIMFQFPVSVSLKIYEGKFKKGLKNGKGTSYGYDGLVEYEGNYKNGKKSGKGQEYYEGTTTLRYKGSYKNDLYHGNGKLYMENGELKHKGKFKKGNYE